MDRLEENSSTFETVKDKETLSAIKDLLFCNLYLAMESYRIYKRHIRDKDSPSVIRSALLYNLYLVLENEDL